MLNLQNVCQQLPLPMHVLLWVAVLGWEYGLGKTKFGSTFGMAVETPVILVLKKLKLIP